MAVNLGPRIPSGADIATKQIANAKNAGAAWLKGMNNPKKDPPKAALLANDKRINNLKKSFEDKSWEKAMEKMDFSTAIATVNALGSSVFTEGIAKREPKIRAAYERLQPLLLAHVQRMDVLPTGTEAEREAKMLANVRGMREIKKLMRG